MPFSKKSIKSFKKKNSIFLLNNILENTIIKNENTLVNSSKPDTNPYNIYGKIDPNVEFYIVYSTSECAYQDWQCELLEASIKNSVDASRCQIIKLLSYDSRHQSENFLLSEDVTFVFPKSNDILNNGEFYAPLNKPYTFKYLTEYWLNNKNLNNNAVFILVDPDMVWYQPISNDLFPPVGKTAGHQWTSENIMFPLIIRAVDLNKMSYKYLDYCHSLYDKNGYHCEMFAFTQSLKENDISEQIIQDFGLDCRCRDPDAYKNSCFLHYCQLFQEKDHKLWYKQDYTDDTLTRPWKRPYHWEKVTETSYRYVLQLLDKLIRYQKSSDYITPRVIKRPTNRLEIYLWGISDDTPYIMENCKYSLATANKFGLKPKILGLNYDWKSKTGNHKFGMLNSRIYIMKELLDKIEDNDDTIFLIMDGFDTLFNSNQTKILENFYKCNTDLLISAEQVYTYQWGEYKNIYDATYHNSKYKYLNAGTYIGYKSAITKMINECINIFEKCTMERNYDCGEEQGFLGRYIAENINNKYQNKLDINNELFWVTSNENNVLNKNPFFNINTGTNPSIIHVIGGRGQDEQIYIDTCNKILLRDR